MKAHSENYVTNLPMLYYSRQPRLGLATYSLFALGLCLFVVLSVCYVCVSPEAY